MDWVPASAALLLTGAMAVAFGGFLLPHSDNSSDALMLVQEEDARWMGVAVIFFLGSVFLTLGLPSVLSLFDRRGWRLALVSTIALACGFLGTAGYSMLMVFFRAIVESGALEPGTLDKVTGDLGLNIFLYGWIAAFYLGELLLAFGLLRARATPRWVPTVMIAHVATVPVVQMLPDLLSKATALLMVAGFAGVAMQAGSARATRGQRRTANTAVTSVRLSGGTV